MFCGLLRSICVDVCCLCVCVCLCVNIYLCTETLLYSEYHRSRSVVYHFMYKLFFSSRNHPVVLGTNHSNLPRILQIFADVFVADALCEDDQLKQRVLRIIVQMQVCRLSFI